MEDSDVREARLRLEREYGEVWDTQQLTERFQVVAFLAPYAEVIRREDGQAGFVEFTHRPRFYFNFRES